MTHPSNTFPESVQRPLPAADARWLRFALFGLAAVGAVGCVSAAIASPRHFYLRYLAAVLSLVSIGAGALFWLLLHYLTGARWSLVLRRLIEHTTIILAPAALLFVPLLFGLTDIFSWASDDVDSLIAAKQDYLNRPFFVLRAVVYFSVWIGLALVCRRRSLRQDAGTGGEGLGRLRQLSAPGMILLALTTTFAAFDWIMSLDPHWYSNIFGVYFWAGAISSSLAVITLLALWTRSRPGMDCMITVEHLHDLGKLQLGFVCFWAYIAFSQYLLIWYANIPEETAWFVQRSRGGWGEVSIALACGHFLLPFLVLLPRQAKRSPIVLGCISVWLLGFHALDLNWQVLPTLGAQAELIHWMDPFVWSLMIAAGLGTVVMVATEHALLPIRDPQLPESVALENE